MAASASVERFLTRLLIRVVRRRRLLWLVCCAAVAGAVALAARGAELVVGTFEDRAAMRSAMAGVDGVFSVQPSSPGGTVTDEQEVRYGITIADLAVECGVKHLVYSSGSAAGETPTGVAHYDTKAEIERHIRRLPLAATGS